MFKTNRSTRRLNAFWRASMFLLLFGFAASSLYAASPTVLRVNVDATKRGKTIGNKVSTVNIWQFQTFQFQSEDEGANLSEFVEHVQFMQATGGNASRDLFLDPDNRDVVDDYDFEPLLNACQGVLNLGAKPFIKLSVPDKFSKETVVDGFGVNALPPDDYEVYFRYVRAMAAALVERFGRDEVRTWGFGVLVEFENASWFHDKAKSPEGSRDAYFKLYDYSVAALCDQLGPDIWIGAHAMACTEGLWDERELLDHCAKGVNAKTGESPIPIKYFAVSFYDDAPDRPHPLTLGETVARIRERANAVGLTDLRFGVDEGRILASRKGKNAGDLTFRIVGQTYQAAFDARIFKILIDSDIDYFSAWSYSSAGPWGGYPLIAYRVAQNVAKFRNAKILSVTEEKTLADGVDCDAVAAFDEGSETLLLMAYNFKYDLNYDQTADVAFDVDAPFWKGRRVKVVETTIDDKENFFCDWLADKERLQIPDDAFSWSPDSGNLDIGWIAPEYKSLYDKELRAKYLEKANLSPRTLELESVIGEDGRLSIATTLSRHAVVFYAVTPIEE